MKNLFIMHCLMNRFIWETLLYQHSEHVKSESTVYEMVGKCVGDLDYSRSYLDYMPLVRLRLISYNKLSYRSIADGSLDCRGIPETFVLMFLDAGRNPKNIQDWFDSYWEREYSRGSVIDWYYYWQSGLDGVGRYDFSYTSLCEAASGLPLFIKLKDIPKYHKKLVEWCS